MSQFVAESPLSYPIGLSSLQRSLIFFASTTDRCLSGELVTLLRTIPLALITRPTDVELTVTAHASPNPVRKHPNFVAEPSDC